MVLEKKNKNSSSKSNYLANRDTERYYPFIETLKQSSVVDKAEVLTTRQTEDRRLPIIRYLQGDADQAGDNDCVAIRVKAKKEILSHQQRAIQKVVLRAMAKMYVYILPEEGMVRALSLSHAFF